MVEVICDTSFLIHLATKRILNIDNLEGEIGIIHFLVPQVVKNELHNLLNNSQKKEQASVTINFIKKFKTIPIIGNYADKSLLEYVSETHAVIATMDKKLKKKIKNKGKPILTIHNNKIIFEN